MGQGLSGTQSQMMASVPGTDLGQWERVKQRCHPAMSTQGQVSQQRQRASALVMWGGRDELHPGSPASLRGVGCPAPLGRGL